MDGILSMWRVLVITARLSPEWIDSLFSALLGWWTAAVMLEDWAESSSIPIVLGVFL
ncbi:MAG: hypothetical protein OEY28_02350 [Nitrospira sp.]|nr:hypothetical protein [Nitrospira sp.]